MSNNVFSKSPISSNSGANHGSTFESAIAAVADDNSEENIKHKVKKVIKNHHSTKSDTDEDHYNKTTKMHEKQRDKHRRCLSYKVNLVLRKSQPSSETSI